MKTDEAKRLVKKASKLANPVQMLKEKADERLASVEEGCSLKLSSNWATNLDPATNAWAFDLFKRNMKEHYLHSQWGYDEASKRQELEATTARYLILNETSKEENGKTAPIAYVHYRFVIDCDKPVLYCYEIQVEPAWHNRGLGSLLLDLLYDLATRTGMCQVMATVFAFNGQSMAFFHKNGYRTDESSPSEEVGADYFILSRPVSDKP